MHRCPISARLLADVGSLISLPRKLLPNTLAFVVSRTSSLNTHTFCRNRFTVASLGAAAIRSVSAGQRRFAARILRAAVSTFVRKRLLRSASFRIAS